MTEPRKQTPESQPSDKQQDEQRVESAESATLTPEQEDKVKGGLGGMIQGIRTN